MTDNLSIPRRDVQIILDDIEALGAKVQQILGRPAPPTRGRIEFGDAVIELPDHGDQWGRHDDPEEN